MMDILLWITKGETDNEEISLFFFTSTLYINFNSGTLDMSPFIERSKDTNQVKCN